MAIVSHLEQPTIVISDVILLYAMLQKLYILIHIFRQIGNYPMAKCE